MEKRLNYLSQWYTNNSTFKTELKKSYCMFFEAIWLFLFFWTNAEIIKKLITPLSSVLFL